MRRIDKRKTKNAIIVLRPMEGVITSTRIASRADELKLAISPEGLCRHAQRVGWMAEIRKEDGGRHLGFQWIEPLEKRPSVREFYVSWIRRDKYSKKFYLRLEREGLTATQWLAMKLIVLLFIRDKGIRLRDLQKNTTIQPLLQIRSRPYSVRMAWGILGQLMEIECVVERTGKREVVSRGLEKTWTVRYSIKQTFMFWFAKFGNKDRPVTKREVDQMRLSLGLEKDWSLSLRHQPAPHLDALRTDGSLEIPSQKTMKKLGVLLYRSKQTAAALHRSTLVPIANEIWEHHLLPDWLRAALNDNPIKSFGLSAFLEGIALSEDLRYREFAKMLGYLKS